VNRVSLSGNLNKCQDLLTEKSADIKFEQEPLGRQWIRVWHCQIDYVYL